MHLVSCNCSWVVSLLVRFPEPVLWQKSGNYRFQYHITKKVSRNFYTLRDIFIETIHPWTVIFSSQPPPPPFQKKENVNSSEHLITKKFISPGILCSTVPANVPISMKTSGPQAFTGPKAPGLDKQLVNASICCSVQGSDVSRRNGTAMLQFEEKDSALNPPLKVCKILSIVKMRNVHQPSVSEHFKWWWKSINYALKPQDSNSVRA